MMKTTAMLVSLVFVLFLGGKGEEPVRTTTLSIYTPYQDIPEKLNGQLKSVNEMNYWAIEKNGKYEPGELITRKDRDSLQWSSDFTAYFNEAGIMTRVDNVTYDWKFDSWVMDVENDKIKKATRIENDTVRFYQKLFYDENGWYKEALSYQSGIDTLRSTHKITNDEEGNYVEIKSYNSAGEPRLTYQYTWEDSKCVKHRIFNASDSLLSESNTGYNDKGFYVKAVYRDGNGEITRTNRVEYTEYDEQGNWLSALIYDNDKATFICKREYGYY